MTLTFCLQLLGLGALLAAAAAVPSARADLVSSLHSWKASIRGSAVCSQTPAACPVPAFAQLRCLITAVCWVSSLSLMTETGRA